MSSSYDVGSGFADTALHEAGHAVIAHLLGFRVDSVIARARANVAVGDETGRVNIGDIDESLEAAVVYAAGEAADWKRSRNLQAWNSRARLNRRPVSDTGNFPAMSEGDKAGLDAYLRAHWLGGWDADKEVKKIKREAERLVAEHWHAITAVADALVDNANPADMSARLNRSQFLAAVGNKAQPAPSAPANNNTTAAAREKLRQLRAK